MVLTIRDRASITAFAEQISHVGGDNKILVLGNGGIAMELLYMLRHRVQLVLVTKDAHVGGAFFDQDVSKFMMNQLPSQEMKTKEKSLEEDAVDDPIASNTMGASLGPHWIRLFRPTYGETQHPTEWIHEANSELKSVELLQSESSPRARVTLTNGHQHDVQLIVCGCGVEPNTSMMDPDEVCLVHQNPALSSSIRKISLSPETNGILVDALMKSNVEGIFAAGDACHANWSTPHWFQVGSRYGGFSLTHI